MIAATPEGSMSEQSLLLTDLYELSMLEAYAAHGMAETAVFELFVRKLPPERGFLMAAGLEQVVEFLETMRLRQTNWPGCGRQACSRRVSSTAWPNCASPVTWMQSPKAQCSFLTSRCCA
jgi:hypothetical protein